MYQSVRLLRSEPRGGLGWGLTLSRFFHTDSQPYAAHAARCIPANSEQGPAAHASRQAWRRRPRSGLRAQEAEALGAGGAACARNPTCFPGLLLSQSSPPPVAPHFSPRLVTGESEEAAAFVPLGKMCLGETSVRPSEEERMQLMSRPGAASYHCRNASFHVRDKGERGIQRASEVPGSR